MIARARINFIRKNWKLGMHLMFHTKRFGVNNDWWSLWDSKAFGITTWRIIWDAVRVIPIIQNYKSMRWRAGALHFMTDEQFQIAFGVSKKKVY
jgi:hypothetical protein